MKTEWLTDGSAIIWIAVIGIALMLIRQYSRMLRTSGNEATERLISGFQEDWPDDLPPMEVYATEVRERTGIQASLYYHDELKISAKDTDTWIGKVIVGAQGEVWPVANGKPMIGICQFNLQSAPHVPESLREFSFITFFLARGKFWNPYSISGDPGTFEIRGYKHGEKLVPLPQPDEIYKDWKPFSPSVRGFTDYASRL